MLNLLFCLIVSFAPAPSGAPEFYVDQTVAYADYGSIYILRLASQILPPDELRSEADVACLIGEIKKSGMFVDVQMELAPGDRSDARILSITATPDPHLQVATLSEVELVGFPKADLASFRRALAKHDVKPGGPFTKYSLGELMDRVNMALQESGQKIDLKNSAEIPWITVRRAGPGEIKLIVSPRYSGCLRN